MDGLANVSVACPRRARRALRFAWESSWLVGRLGVWSDARSLSLFAMIRRTTARRRLEVIREGLVDQASRGSTAAEGAIRARAEPFYRVRRSGPAYLLQAQGR